MAREKFANVGAIKTYRVAPARTEKADTKWVVNLKLPEPETFLWDFFDFLWPLL